MHTRPSGMNDPGTHLYKIAYGDRLVKIDFSDRYRHAVPAAPIRRTDISGLIKPFHGRPTVDISSKIDVRWLRQES